MTVNRLLIARCISACFALACLPGIVAAQPRMGLVGPGVGWALQYRGAGPGSDDRLFWTSDDGANWKDITPQDPASHEIAGVFFLDPSRGWVLLALKRELDNQAPRCIVGRRWVDRGERDLLLRCRSRLDEHRIARPPLGWRRSPPGDHRRWQHVEANY